MKKKVKQNKLSLGKFKIAKINKFEKGVIKGGNGGNGDECADGSGGIQVKTL